MAVSGGGLQLGVPQNLGHFVNRPAGVHHITRHTVSEIVHPQLLREENLHFVQDGTDYAESFTFSYIIN
jgi:hypothetical protein